MGILACAGTRVQPRVHVHTHARPVCAPGLTCPRDTRVHTQARTHTCAGSLSTPMCTHILTCAHTSSRVCVRGAHSLLPLDSATEALILDSALW